MKYTLAILAIFLGGCVSSITIGGGIPPFVGWLKFDFVASTQRGIAVNATTFPFDPTTRKATP